MARIRTIKPQFWTDEDMVDLPFEYRLLYIGIWNFTDDEGFIEDKPKQIKLQVFPGDDVDVAAGIRALVKTGALERLTLDGDKVLRVKGWKTHQVISRPTKSKWHDAYADYQAERSTHGVLTEYSRRTHGGLHREGKGREGKGKERSITQVGGGTHLSSGAPNEPPPPASTLDHKPWRCAKHQDADVACYDCKDAKAAWKAQQAAAAKAAKEAQRQADAEDRRQREAEAAATERATPEQVKAALAKAGIAKGGAK